MLHKVWYDEENKILREKIIGGITEEDIPELLAKVDEIFKDKKKCLALIDLTEATEQAYSKEARMMLAEGSAKLGYNEKIAFIGANYRVRMFAKILISGAKFLGKPIKSRFFDTEDEALEWLREEGGVKVHE